MITVFWIWVGLMAWFVPGYIAGKAAFRQTKSTAFGILIMMFGIAGYIAGWEAANKEMKEIHGLGSISLGEHNIGAKFFGEVEK